MVSLSLLSGISRQADHSFIFFTKGHFRYSSDVLFSIEDNSRPSHVFFRSQMYKSREIRQKMAKVDETLEHNVLYTVSLLRYWLRFRIKINFQTLAKNSNRLHHRHQLHCKSRGNDIIKIKVRESLYTCMGIRCWHDPPGLHFLDRMEPYVYFK